MRPSVPPPTAEAGREAGWAVAAPDQGAVVGVPEDPPEAREDPPEAREDPPEAREDPPEVREDRETRGPGVIQVAAGSREATGLVPRKPHAACLNITVRVYYLRPVDAPGLLTMCPSGRPHVPSAPSMTFR